MADHICLTEEYCFADGVNSAIETMGKKYGTQIFVTEVKLIADEVLQ